MTCRHSSNDPDCTRGGSRNTYSSAPPTPDASNYSIEDVVRVGNHLVLKAKYPNCSSCSYEGTKVMVFLNVSELQVLKWKKVDPHFRDPKKTFSTSREAPSPVARFPASEEGWKDAINFAKSKLVEDVITE